MPRRRDQITYVPNAHVREVDPFNQRIKTAVGDFNFDHAILMAGHVANRHARIVAKYIAERAAGREPACVLPDNLCYMMVNAEPQLDSAVQFDYKVDEKGVIIQTQIDDNERRSELVQEDFGRAWNMYQDMFA